MHLHKRPCPVAAESSTPWPVCMAASSLLAHVIRTTFVNAAFLKHACVHTHKVCQLTQVEGASLWKRTYKDLPGFRNCSHVYHPTAASGVFQGFLTELLLQGVEDTLSCCRPCYQAVRKQFTLVEIPAFCVYFHL
jgi:hypothetical protein